MREEDCDHPSVIQGSDGHTKTWWNCSVCGKYYAIAPWILNRGKILNEGKK